MLRVASGLVLINLRVAKGIRIEKMEIFLPHREMVAAQDHCRYFTRLRAEHPIGEAALASDVLCVLSIGQQIAVFAGNIRGLALASRTIFDPFQELSEKSLWSSAFVRCTTTLRGHKSWVHCLASLPDHRLASGSNKKTIKI